MTRTQATVFCVIEWVATTLLLVVVVLFAVDLGVAESDESTAFAVALGFVSVNFIIQLALSILLAVGIMQSSEDSLETWVCICWVLLVLQGAAALFQLFLGSGGGGTIILIVGGIYRLMAVLTVRDYAKFLSEGYTLTNFAVTSD